MVVEIPYLLDKDPNILADQMPESKNLQSWKGR